MGANMTPMTKKSGSTVLGVRMGLRRSAWAVAAAAGGFDVLPCLEALLAESGIWRQGAWSAGGRHRVEPGQSALAGLLLFVFLPSSACGSWLLIESVCGGPSVCDMMGRGSTGGCRCDVRNGGGRGAMGL